MFLNDNERKAFFPTSPSSPQCLLAIAIQSTEKWIVINSTIFTQSSHASVVVSSSFNTEGGGMLGFGFLCGRSPSA